MSVYGASLDDVEDLKKFAADQELPFLLLSDPDGSAATKYAVHKGRFAARVTFVIDPKGILRLIDDSVDVSKHGSDLAEKIAALQDE